MSDVKEKNCRAIAHKCALNSVNYQSVRTGERNVISSFYIRMMSTRHSIALNNELLSEIITDEDLIFFILKCFRWKKNLEIIRTKND